MCVRRKLLLGFSVVEMLVVIVIIGLLSLMALSTYRKTTAKARQAEAKVNLKQIGDLMEAWSYEHGKYEDELDPIGATSGNCTNAQIKNKLGYRPKDCEKLRYVYDVNPPVSSSTFTSQASNNPKVHGYIWTGCDNEDFWQGNEKGEILQPEDGKNVLLQCE